MKDIKVELGNGQATIDVFPSCDGERIIANCSRVTLVGSAVQIREVSASVGESLELGEETALEDCLRPEGELGYHRIVMGKAFLARIEGREPTEYEEITDNGLFETQPELNN